MTDQDSTEAARLRKRMALARQRPAIEIPLEEFSGTESQVGESALLYLMPGEDSLLALEAEGEGLIRDVLLQLDHDKRDALLEACKRECLQAVIRPFGVARLIFVNDREGGPVDTIHNVSTQSKDRKGNRRFLAEEKRATESGEVIATSREYTIDQSGRATYVDDGSAVSETVINRWSRPIFVFATDEERHKHDQAVNNAGEVAEKVRQQKAYKAKVGETKEQLEDGSLADPLSKEGRNFGAGEPVHVDHTVPCIEIAQDARASLADIPVDKLANMKINLMPMREYANTSKNGDPVKLVVQRWEKNIQAISKIEEMRSNSPLTPKQEETLRKLKELQAMDLAKLMEADETVRNEITRIVRSEYYFGEKFRERVIHTSISAGFKMGTQQAVGVLLEEFVLGALAEIKDAWRNGIAKIDQSFWAALKERLARVASRVAAKWKHAVKAFQDGSVSGFISNILTIAINCFVTTAAKWVRIIREGFMSLYRALKLLAFPPAGMTPADASHEASKILVAGAIVGLGVLVEEALAVAIGGMPGGIVSWILSAVVGIVTGLTTACATYMLDKLDLFEVHANKRHDLLIGKLHEIIDGSYEHAMEAGKIFDGPFGEMT